jgi:hypothetical protein
MKKLNRNRTIALSALLTVMIGQIMLFQNCSGGFTPARNSSGGPAVDGGPVSPGTPGTVQLKWLAPFSGVPQSYEISQSTDNKTFTVIQTVPGTVTAAAVSGLNAGTYYFNIKSVNSAGTSNPSISVSAVVP